MGKYTIMRQNTASLFILSWEKDFHQSTTLINRDQSSFPCPAVDDFIDVYCWLWHDTELGPGPCEIVVKSIRVGSISDKKSRRVAHHSHQERLLEKGRLVSAVTCRHFWRLIIMLIDHFSRDKRHEAGDFIVIFAWLKCADCFKDYRL